MTSAGKYPTVVFLFPINLNRLDYAGVLHEPAAAGLFCSPIHVIYTIAAGKLIIKEGHFVTLDLPKLIKDHKFTSRKLMENE